MGEITEGEGKKRGKRDRRGGSGGEGKYLTGCAGVTNGCY